MRTWMLLIRKNVRFPIYISIFFLFWQLNVLEVHNHQWRSQDGIKCEETSVVFCYDCNFSFETTTVELKNHRPPLTSTVIVSSPQDYQTAKFLSIRQTHFTRSCSRCDNLIPVKSCICLEFSSCCSQRTMFVACRRRATVSCRRSATQQWKPALDFH